MRGCLQCYKWVGLDGWMGWDGMVIIGHRSSKSTFGANKDKPKVIGPEEQNEQIEPKQQSKPDL